MKTIAVLLTAALLAGCVPAADDEEVAELEQRVAELEAELAEARGEDPETTSEEPADDEGDPPESETGEGDDEGADEEGGRHNPVPRGESARISDWEVTVTDVVPDATEQVLAHNEFNEPPEEGRQFFMVAVNATYVGPESGQFWADLTMRAVGDSNVTYTSFEDTCGPIPDSIDETGEAFEGGQVSGNVCWSVESADVDSLKMFVEDALAFDQSSRTWFTLVE